LADIKNDKYINTLAKVKNVQFVDAEVGLNLMNTDASGTAVDTDRHIIDIYGTQATVRTDGFFKPSL
jgi:hypothetical protein